MNAKQRRIEKRRNEKRFGLTDQQFKNYRTQIKHGESHNAAIRIVTTPKDQPSN